MLSYLSGLSSRSTKLIIAVLCLLTLVTYIWSLPNDFVWDDEEQVVHNGAVHRLSNIPSFFAGSTFNTGGAGSLSGIYYKPLMTTSFAFLYSLGGGQAWSFHLFQVLMHLGNVVLVFLILRQLLDSRELAAAAAAVFALHPLNVESVVYISALQDTQFLFFGLLALWSVINWQRLDFLYGKAIPGLLLLASLLSKETGVVMVGVYVLYVIIFGHKQQFSKKDYFWQAGNVLGSLGLYTLLRLGVAQVGVGTQGLSPITTASVGERLLTVPKIIGYYLSNFILPYKLAIAQHWLVTSLGWWQFWLPLLIISGLVAAGIFVGFKLWQQAKQDFRLFAFFWLWFWGAMLLHLHPVPLDMTVADRWFYAPMVGLLGMLAVIWQYWGSRVFKAKKAQQGILVFFGLVLLLLAGRSVVRIRNWQDGLTLFSHDIHYSRNAFDLENNLGTELMRSGRVDEAKLHFERSTELLPNWWTNWNNLGVVYERQGDMATAREYYQKAINNGDYYLAYQNMASLLYQEEGPEAANDFVTESLKKLPQNPQLNYLKAVTEYELDNNQQALIYARRTFQLAPSAQSRQLLNQIITSQRDEE